MILVDTNVWSELLKPLRNDQVLSWIDAQWQQLALSSIVLAELRFGVAKLDDGRRKTAMQRTVDQLAERKSGFVIGFGVPEAIAYGDLMGRMKRAGKSLPILDGQIAAQALANGLVVATRNIADFERTGVTHLNPWEA